MALVNYWIFWFSYWSFLMFWILFNVLHLVISCIALIVFDYLFLLLSTLWLCFERCYINKWIQNKVRHMHITILAPQCSIEREATFRSGMFLNIDLRSNERHINGSVRFDSTEELTTILQRFRCGSTSHTHLVLVVARGSASLLSVWWGFRRLQWRPDTHAEPRPVVPCPDVPEPGMSLHSGARAALLWMSAKRGRGHCPLVLWMEIKSVSENSHTQAVRLCCWFVCVSVCPAWPGETGQASFDLLIEFKPRSKLWTQPVWIHPQVALSNVTTPFLCVISPPSTGHSRLPACQK